MVMQDNEEEEDQIDEDNDEEQEDEEEIITATQPPVVPEGGSYIDALNEAGIDPMRIEQLQQNIAVDEFNIF